MPSMKVYLHGGGDGRGREGDAMPLVTLKVKLPKSWLPGPASKVLTLFVDNYNKKHPENAMKREEVHLETSKGRAVNEEAVVETTFEDKEDVYIVPGAAPSAEEVAAAAAEEEAAAAAASGGAGSAAKDTRPVCRNYGCGQRFDEATNDDTSCRHHSKPPIFHDTKKGWSCCSDKLVYDWDAFQKLEGCTWGRHSTVDPKTTFAASPTIAAAEAAEAKAATPVMSASEYASANAHRPSAAKSAAKAAAGPVRPKERRTDGTAACLNQGCRQDFVIAENNDTACRHHTAAPVFHDGGKYWSCCPEKKAMEFDAFLQIKGCAVGPHKHGWEEEDAAAAAAE